MTTHKDVESARISPEILSKNSQQDAKPKPRTKQQKANAKPYRFPYTIK